MRCRRCGKRIGSTRTGLCVACFRADEARKQKAAEALRAYYARTTYASLGRGERMSPKERERLLRNVARLNPGLLGPLMRAMETWERLQREG